MVLERVPVDITEIVCAGSPNASTDLMHCPVDWNVIKGVLPGPGKNVGYVCLAPTTYIIRIGVWIQLYCLQLQKFNAKKIQ